MASRRLKSVTAYVFPKGLTHPQPSTSWETHFEGSALQDVVGEAVNEALSNAPENVFDPANGYQETAKVVLQFNWEEADPNDPHKPEV